MPRYYFDAVNGGRDIDTHGVELPDDDAAVSQAVKFAGDMMSDDPSVLDANNEFFVTARATGDRVVAQVRVALERPGQ